MIKSSLAIICIVLSIVLLLPMICRRLHIPAIVGFILMGMGIGPLGFNLIAESETIRVLGQLGMLYIMFQSGSEMDLGEMRTQRWRSTFFGVYTFSLPFVLGLLTSHYLLSLDWTTSTLLGAMYGSHTLMTYPIVSRYGLQKNRAVTIVVGGTVLALTVSLIILAELTHPVDFFNIWTILGIAFYVFVVLWAFPVGGRWFLKRYQDPVADYILMMLLLVLAAEGASLIGLEPILGAFIAGIALNPLLPNHSPLMSRVTFVGNTIFVPLFLFSVGMLIDVSAFFSSWTVLMIAGVMIATKLLGKWLAAALSQWQFRLLNMERQLIFGLTHATAAGTLAIVQIGYNAGIFSSEVLNAAVLMILILSTISSFVTEHATKQLALQEEARLAVDKDVDEWLV
ncbi:MAG: cation:proton antiporter, partial [Bacteroidales bacterium]|nr:cation:proton antiporter [Candidatus Colicola coprequi]